jgi:transposase
MPAKLRKKHPSTKLKACIVGLSEAGMSHGAIARKFGMVRQTISGIIARFSKRRTVESAPKPGRPRKTGKQDLLQLANLLKQNMLGVSDLMDTPISITTTRQQAHNLGFNNCVAAEKPFLNDHLQFAEEHKDWTVNDWRSVLWTNKLSFEIGKSSKQIRVWQKNTRKKKKKILRLPSRADKPQ